MSSQFDTTELRLQGPTPEFVRWALEQPCSLRTNARWKEPEHTERQLRPIREYSLAKEEGRIFEGICVEPSVTVERKLDQNATGFRAREVLETYGGLEAVESTCAACPANLPTRYGQGLVGCHGWLEVDSLGKRFHEVMDDVVSRRCLSGVFSNRFLKTTPWWYGLWVNSPIQPNEAKIAMQLLEEVASRGFWQVLDGLVSALRASATKQVPIHVQLSPRGHADNDGWLVFAHCPRCKAELSDTPHICRTCGRNGQAIAPRLRNTRGSRPFWKLGRFLGGNEVIPFLQRYFASHQQSGQPIDKTGP